MIDDNEQMMRLNKQSFVAGFMGAMIALCIALIFFGVLVGVKLKQGNVASMLTSFVSGTGVDVVDGQSVSGVSGGIVEVVAKVNPAVVSIVATKDVPVMEQYNQNIGFGFSIPQYRQNGTKSQEVSSGSGFIISADGYVVTNQHVVADSTAAYTVILTDGTKYDATVVALGDVYDIALLKIEDDGSDLPYLQFGDSDALKQGQQVIAIGNALGQFRNTVSVGVVSGLSRSVTASSGQGQSELLQDVIQTDAAINAGNSGGPLLDLAGFVIGVNVAASNAQNIGFALPANEVNRSISDMKEFGHIVRPFLGVRFVTIDQAMIETNNLTVDHGALLLRGSGGELAVMPGSPADKAGLEENDIILQVDGVEVTESKPLNILLQNKTAGEKVLLKIEHDGEEKQVYVTLGEPPKSS
jgi:serine protease Do